MKTVLDIITPIKLLQGSHSDTAQTGQGCAMNVIAYLNGEDQITDDSPCVCVTVRKPLIWLNDFLHDDERQELVPYLLRAVGSTTNDSGVINQRLVHVVKMANIMADVAKRATQACAYNSAGTYASASDAANSTAASKAAAKAATAALYGASAAAGGPASTYAAYHAEIKAAGFAFLDAVLPKTETHGNEVFERAKELAKTYELSA